MTSLAVPSPAEALRNLQPVVLAIDPGPERSAWLVLEQGMPAAWGYEPNGEVLRRLREHDHGRFVDWLVIEKVEGYGMPVGAETFETVYWSGRFAEAADPLPVDRLGRKRVKAYLCGTTAAKEPNVRQALLDRFGGTGGKAAAVGLKATPGPLYGISGDVWAALALAVTWADLHAEAVL